MSSLIINTGLPSGPDLRLQVCGECRQVNYPPRELCGNCLADSLTWHKVLNSGVVQSVSTLHNSMEPVYQGKLPLQVASVQLDSTVVVFTCLKNPVAIGQRVTVSVDDEQLGMALLFASATTNSVKEDKI